ncbi:MAG: Gfo/Idh/MocA family oxidoreductase [Candidatus Nanopelagicales bacterium]
MLRAGLVGLGSMGVNHARVLAQLPDVEFVGVVDPVAEQGLRSQGRPVLTDLDALLDLDLDYAVVATPTATHLPLGLRLAQAGVHVLIEKPLTLDAAEAGELTAAFESRGLVGAVGHIERYNPALQQARDRIEAGQLGEIHQVATRRQGPFPARIGDVGVILDLATHDIDLTAWVTRSQYTAVSARTAHRSGRRHEDLVAITGTLADETVTSHLVNWLSPMKERVTVITGERGALVADTLTADLTFFENGVVPLGWPMLESFRGVSEGNMTRYAFAKPEPLAVEHERFRDAVLGKSDDIIHFAAGARTVRVAQAVLESARTGTTVTCGMR